MVTEPLMIGIIASKILTESGHVSTLVLMGQLVQIISTNAAEKVVVKNI